MTKSELEKKPLSDLHLLAADAGVERFRMLTKAELVDKLADGNGGGGDGESGGGGRAPRSGRGRSTSGSGRTGTNAGEGRSGGSGEGGERPRRRRRRSGSGSGGREREAAHEETEEEGAERLPEPTPPERAPEPTPVDRSAAAASDDEGSARPKRRRRRRRFGRRKDGVSLQDLLLPPESGRQAVLVGETRAACTALLRGVAADLAGESKGPDPVALLIDPTPEELADWKREAPQAEIVSAGQARHATDALALAKTRAASEDVILLVDSLTRLAEEFGDTDTAKDFFDAGQAVSGTGSLTVVVALERPAAD
jgi:transcription termination factor Rho